MQINERHCVTGTGYERNEGKKLSENIFLEVAKSYWGKIKKPNLEQWFVNRFSNSQAKKSH
jgi:hypothetical protein